MDSFTGTTSRRGLWQNTQEGWLSPTKRESVSAISLMHNLVISGESRRYVVVFTRFAGGGIWLPQENLRHILASPRYAPGTIAVNVTWMERGFNACQTHRSIYPSTLYLHTPDSVPVIEPVSSNVHHFVAHFGLPWVYSWDNLGKCYMNGKKIQCWSNALQHIPIYLQPFTSYIARYWSEIATFSYTLAFGPQKTRIMGLPGSEDSLTIG